MRGSKEPGSFILSLTFSLELVIVRVAASGRLCVYIYLCVCGCVLLLLDSRPLHVCSLCLGVSVSHLVSFLEGVRSCFTADTEHKDALSGVGPWAKSGGTEETGICVCTHTHKVFLRALSGERSRGPGGLSFSSLIMTVWQAGKQEVSEGRDGKREGW